MKKSGLSKFVAKMFTQLGVFCLFGLGLLGCTKNNDKKSEAANLSPQGIQCEQIEGQLGGIKIVNPNNLITCIEAGRFYYMSGIQSSKTNSLATWGPFEVKVESKSSKEVSVKVYSTSSKIAEKPEVMNLKVVPGDRISLNGESAIVVFSSEIPTKKSELNLRRIGHVKLDVGSIGEAYVRAIQPTHGEDSLYRILEFVKLGTSKIKTPPGELAFSTVSRPIVGGATLLVVGEERNFLVATYFAIDPSTGKPSGRPEFFYLKKEDFQLGPRSTSKSSKGATSDVAPETSPSKIEGLGATGVEIRDDELDLWLDQGDSESLSPVEPTIGIFSDFSELLSEANKSRMQTQSNRYESSNEIETASFELKTFTFLWILSNPSSNPKFRIRLCRGDSSCSFPLVISCRADPVRKCSAEPKQFEDKVAFGLEEISKKLYVRMASVRPVSCFDFFIGPEHVYEIQVEDSGSKWGPWKKFAMDRESADYWDCKWPEKKE